MLRAPAAMGAAAIEPARIELEVAVRVGVDVGGTFTKAVACDAATGQVVARALVPTTHASPVGVADGVVEVLQSVFREVDGEGWGPILLVAHSTTQAVNALLEGDTATVGVIGIGRGRDVRRARSRTRMGDVRLAPGRSLRTVHGFLDATNGLTVAAVDKALRDLLHRGAQSICASEAFGVEDPAGERLVVRAAADLGVPAGAGHELSGLYGLEVRTVTAALNASILPAALRTAAVVEDVVSRECPGVPMLVMRGDGGAADLATMRRRPLLTAFSGPAASVAGALRHLAVRDGVVIEVGGTSTNVSSIHGGRPVLAYIRVLEHVTFVRSLDVRVVGVAGGSLLRVGRRLGRARLVDVGPRSAHIAGLPYCSFARPDELAGAQARLVAPRPGDPPHYPVVETPDGRLLGLTLTCAANALGLVPEDAYARGDREAARRGFEALGRLLGRPGEELARRALDMGAARVASVVAEVVAEHGLHAPEIVGLGGGAGALIPAVAGAAGLRWSIPPDAEVISSIGDALSLVRVEVERGIADRSGEFVAELLREAEEAAVTAGASPSSLHVETESVPERAALRAVAIGSVALQAGPPLGGGEAGEDALWTVARERLGQGAELATRTPFYGVFRNGRRRFLVVDRLGSVALMGRGEVVSAPGEELADILEQRLPRLVRHLGPIAVAPEVRIVRGARLVDLTFLSGPDRVLEAAVGECRLAGSENVVALVSAG